MSLSSLRSTLLLAYSHNPTIHFHVFLHKMDGLSEDYRDDTQTDVEKRVEDDLSDASSAFAFAPGVDAKAWRTRIERDDEDESRNQRLDWSYLEKKADRARQSAAAGGGQEETPQSSSSLLDQPPKAAGRQNEPYKRRRQSSVRSNSGIVTGVGSSSSSAYFSLETEVRLSLHQTSIFDSSMFVAFSRVLNDLVLRSPGKVLRHALARLIDHFVESTCVSSRAAGSSYGQADVGQSADTEGSMDPSRPTPAAASIDVDKLYLMHLPTRTYLVTDSSPFEKTSFDVVCDYMGFLVGINSLFSNVKSPRADFSDQSAGERGKSQRQKYQSSTLRLQHPASATGSGGVGAGMAIGSGSAPMSASSGSLGGGPGSYAAAGSSLGEAGSGVAGNTGASAGAAGMGGNNSNNSAANDGGGSTSGGSSLPVEETRLSFWQLDDSLGLVAILRCTDSPSGNGSSEGSSNKGTAASTTAMSSGVVDNADANQGSTQPPQPQGTSSIIDELMEENVGVLRRALRAMLAMSRDGKGLEDVHRELGC